jgi:hypothetical protein
MTKTKESNEQESLQSVVSITPEIAKSIEDLIFQQKNIARDQETFKESLAAVAEKLGIKPAELNSRIKIIIKEEEKGGEIKNKTQQIDFVEEYFKFKSNNDFN